MTLNVESMTSQKLIVTLGTDTEYPEESIRFCWRSEFFRGPIQDHFPGFFSITRWEIQRSMLPPGECV